MVASDEAVQVASYEMKLREDKRAARTCQNSQLKTDKWLLSGVGKTTESTNNFV